MTDTTAALVDDSRDLLLAARRGDADAALERVATMDEKRLLALRDDRAAALAFWLNCYNAFVQVLLAERPDAYDDRRRFFGERRFAVAGTERSLDDIEHGILRRSRWEYGLGYLPRFGADGFERRHRLPHRDARVHFALNCGAASCPAVRPYAAADVDAELDAATAAYLDAEVEYDPDRDVVRIPRLFLWYRGDFGGRRGIRAFLRRHDALPPGATPGLRYRDYDWSMDRGNWAET